MKLCELTLPTPEENLACDEVLLDVCEAGQGEDLLRLWESPQYFVVVGYGNQAAREVHLPFCQLNTVPVLRRCTGGGTVLQGPGCLNYALVLRLKESGPLGSITGTNEFILQRHRDTLAALVKAPVEAVGQTDLAIGGLKFSGNAQRRKKNFLLFHGTFLLHLDLALMEKALPLPSKQPDYRLHRSHMDFLMNLKVPASLLKAALKKAWGARQALAGIPFDQITAVAREKYGDPEWNFKS